MTKYTIAITHEEIKGNRGDYASDVTDFKIMVECSSDRLKNVIQAITDESLKEEKKVRSFNNDPR